MHKVYQVRLYALLWFLSLRTPRLHACLLHRDFKRMRIGPSVLHRPLLPCQLPKDGINLTTGPQASLKAQTLLYVWTETSGRFPSCNLPLLDGNVKLKEQCDLTTTNTEVKNTITPSCLSEIFQESSTHTSVISNTVPYPRQLSCLHECSCME